MNLEMVEDVERLSGELSLFLSSLKGFYHTMSQLFVGGRACRSSVARAPLAALDVCALGLTANVTN